MYKLYGISTVPELIMPMSIHNLATVWLAPYPLCLIWFCVGNDGMTVKGDAYPVGLVGMNINLPFATMGINKLD